jgi:pimeloyl-ACP methyl ester carboxylesterase
MGRPVVALGGSDLVGAGTGMTIASDLEVVEAGSGPTLGLLHGMLGTPASSALVAALARTHRVIAPNLPGFGRSTAREHRTFYDWVWTLSEVIDRVGLAGKPVVASSVGAMLATDLATVRPDAFERLVLLAPLGLWVDTAPIHDVWSERTPRQPAWLVGDVATLAPFFDDDPHATPDERTEAELRRYRTRRSAASIMWPIPERGLCDRIHRLQRPVHVVWGGRDRLAPAEVYGPLWQRLLPVCTGLTLLDTAGHLLEWDAPNDTAATVLDALAAMAGTVD